MIVVADTSPLNYLIEIDEIELLPVLFQQVLIPQAVFQELQHAKTSTKVRSWIAAPPSWLRLHGVSSGAVEPSLRKLDIGEREAISLALELGLSTVLIDEAEGRQAAERLHLEVRGTLGILERASKLGKVDFRSTLEKLDRTSFRISPMVRAVFLERNP